MSIPNKTYVFTLTVLSRERSVTCNVTVTVPSFTCILGVPGYIHLGCTLQTSVSFRPSTRSDAFWRGSASLGWQFLVAGGTMAVQAMCNEELLGQFVTKQVEAGCSIAPRANFSSHTNGLQQERPISGKKCSF